PRRHDDRDAGGLAAARLGVADEHAGHVGDGVARARREEAHRAGQVAPAGHTRMHAARCCGDVTPSGLRSSGSIVLQRSTAIGQRGWKRQPAGMWTGFGVSPVRICGTVESRGSRFGTTEMSAFVYGWSGVRTTSLAGPSSTIRPRYMTAIRSAKCAAVDRSCVIITM